MFKTERLRIKNLNEFADLNSKRREFNSLNEEYFKYYNKSNFIGRYQLRKQVCLLRYGNKLVGYLWHSKIDSGANAYLINSLYVDKNYMDINCSELLKDFKAGSVLYFDGKLSEEASNLLSRFGFEEKSTTFELKLTLNSKRHEPLIDNLNFVTFKKGRHEKIRCDIQNSVFFNFERQPLTIQDILADEMQDYYVNDWCIFIKYNNDYAGYGQIIMHNFTPLIVNFGIKKEYQRRGFGQLLLTHLLNILIDCGYNEVKIKVNADNTPAYELYKKCGFKLFDQYKTWTTLIKT
ncbi:GNAT family N-acetyltransferase [Clostridium thermarum]|uniref:GNAT family N-acetyltransferase n=1 Tax=Clostridium thermarum TaxID=1716543 RepID=UPI0013D0D91B|nr:GNAT family N-acetyltransferase [Clostridium thermarum]